MINFKPKLGIIGYGFVGQALAYGFSTAELRIFDKYKEGFHELKEVCEQSEFIFICLPTPIKEDESGIDLAIINDSLKQITKYTDNTNKIIVIKSTVIPGTTAHYAKKYPNSAFAFNPEFLTERNYLQDFVNADRTIIGALNDEVSKRVTALYLQQFPKTPIFKTDPTTAEMVKYMGNCYLATKVIFANEMYEICEKLNIKYEEVKKMVVADHRIFDSHLDITSEKGFGGKCFPKDLLALRALAKSKDANTDILDTVWKKNLSIRKLRDWDEIPFAVTKVQKKTA
jgi:UDPglucose 6-dehydrogenase